MVDQCSQLLTIDRELTAVDIDLVCLSLLPTIVLPDPAAAAATTRVARLGSTQKHAQKKGCDFFGPTCTLLTILVDDFVASIRTMYF